MKKIFVLSFVLLFCSAAVFAASKNPDTITASLSVKNKSAVYNAVLKGCGERGWIPSKSGENEITAALDIRGHHVTVRIPYDEQGYKIIYKDSRNMNYNAKRNTIHPKYNQWTANLDKSIKNNIDFKEEMK